MAKERIIANEKEESLGYKEYKEIIEAYKKQNPVKYELKKEALLAKLESLK